MDELLKETQEAKTAENTLIHSFSKVLARDHKIGIKGAILLEGLAYKIGHSRNLRDGLEWFYCSLDELVHRYPYFSRSGLDAILKNLESAGFLKVGNYNQRAGDKTRWYAIPDPSLRSKASEDLLYFKVADASNFGIVAAVLLGNITYHVARNREDQPDYQWHRLSAAKMAELIPASQNTISRTLVDLCGKELESRETPGWDRCREYRLMDETRVAAVHPSKRDIHPSIPDIHESKRDIHQSILDIHQSKLDDVTHMKTPQEDSTRRHTQTASRTSSSACVSVSIPLGRMPDTETVDLHSASSLPGAAVQGAGDGMKRQSFSSPDISQLTDAEYHRDLSPEQKVEVLKVAIRKMNEEQHTNSSGLPVSHLITVTKRAWKTALEFFHVHPDWPVAMLTDALQRCIHANLYFKLEGYDRSLFLLHRGVDLVFLLKYYDEINATHRFQDFITDCDSIPTSELGATTLTGAN